MYKLRIFFTLAITLLFTTGCVQQNEVYTTFLMPPKKLQNIEDVKNIKIDVNDIKLSGFSNNAQIDMQEMIEGKTAGLIFNEQFLNVFDPIISNNIQQLNQNAKNHHGYRRFYADKNTFSTLKIYTSLKLKRRSGTDVVKTQLVHQNYGVKTDKKGRPSAIPSGKPSYRTVKNNVKYVQYDVTANLKCKLYNAKNKLIYSKDFNNIVISKKIGGDTLAVTEIPTEIEIASEALMPKLREVVFEISPYKESRKLVVNEKGNSSVVALMKGTAFSEAIVLLDSVIEKQEKEIKLKKSDLENEYDEKFTKAKDAKEKEELQKSKDEKLLSLYKSLSPEYENMGILNEILGDLVSSKYYYELSYKYDNVNVRADESIKRVEETLSKVNQLNKISAKTKYKNQVNKDR